MQVSLLLGNILQQLDSITETNEVSVTVITLRDFLKVKIRNAIYKVKLPDETKKTIKRSEFPDFITNFATSWRLFLSLDSFTTISEKAEIDKRRT